MTEGLVVWLRAQLDEDERIANAADGERWYLDLGSDAVVEHFQRHDPARVRAEVDAKRRILDAYAGAAGAEESEYDGGVTVGLLTALRLLALPYADRPGYRLEWAFDVG